MDSQINLQNDDVGILADKNQIDSLLSNFRNEYTSYLSGSKDSTASEQPSIQNNVTQHYWHTLFLKKQRLDQKHMTLQVNIRRTKHGDDRSVRTSRRQDGKYIVHDVLEDIIAKRIYYLNNTKIRTLRNNDIANYQLIESKKTIDTCTCPNCGAESTLENLLDGCDFCGTKFKIEDFKTKVSHFELRKDASSLVNRGNAVLEKFVWISAVLWGLPAAFLTLILCVDEQVGFLYTVGGMLGVGGLFGVVGWWIGLALFYIGWFLGSLFSLGNDRKKNNKTQKHNASFEKSIRAHDPLFSVEDFTSNVQNRLSCIHFASSMPDIGAFVLCDLNDILPKYKDVIDCDLISLQLLGYSLEDTGQKMTVMVKLQLFLLQNKKILKKAETLNIVLSKDKDRLTEQVFNSVVYRCQSCGSSIGIVEGGVCQYCGTKLDLSKYDWVIERYKTSL